MAKPHTEIKIALQRVGAISLIGTLLPFIAASTFFNTESLHGGSTEISTPSVTGEIWGSEREKLFEYGAL